MTEPLGHGRLEIIITDMSLINHELPSEGPLTMGMFLDQGHIHTDSHPAYFGIWSKCAASPANKVPIRKLIVPPVVAGRE